MHQKMQNFNANPMQLTENGVFHISFELFPQHSCQVVYHRPPKLQGTGNTFSRSFFSIQIVRPL